MKYINRQSWLLISSQVCTFIRLWKYSYHSSCLSPCMQEHGFNYVYGTCGPCFGPKDGWLFWYETSTTYMTKGWTWKVRIQRLYCLLNCLLLFNQIQGSQCLSVNIIQSLHGILLMKSKSYTFIKQFYFNFSVPLLFEPSNGMIE